MKTILTVMVLMSSGILILIFALIWLNHDFDYAWLKIQNLLDDATA
jgi:hypothetical protein